MLTRLDSSLFLAMIQILMSHRERLLIINGASFPRIYDYQIAHYFVGGCWGVYANLPDADLTSQLNA